MSVETDAINEKLDALAAGHEAHFDAVMVAKIKTSVAFTEKFNSNPETLLEIEKAFRAAQGFVKVTRTVGVVIAFIVLLATNWQRLSEWLQWGSKP